MARSALAGIFREYTVTYETITGTYEDEDGNVVPLTSSTTLTIRFEPYKTPQLLFQEGADARVIRGKAQCMNPSVLPGGLHAGTELDMTYDGLDGKLRIVQVSEASLTTIDTIIGQEFIAEWRPV